MKFKISSTILSQNLQAIGKVISNKSPLPILDYFLFQIEEDELKITASDIETTMQTTLKVENVDGAKGSVAVPSRRILDSLKEFAEQPLTLDIDAETCEITVLWGSGKLSIPGVPGIGYPEQQSLSAEGATSVTLTTGLIGEGISSTVFAVADDSLRPVMNGINVALSPESITFVATDAHRLVRLINPTVNSANSTSFILPTKPANLLRSILPKDTAAIVTVEYDEKNVVFSLPSHRLICRLIEGNYPNYNAVIPKDNANNFTVNRTDFMASIRRVSVCSSQASGLIHLNIGEGGIRITAQDLDYNTSAEDFIQCEYNGDSMEIGFKASFLIDILSNIHTTEVMIKLSDPTRPGLFVPVAEDEDEKSNVLMLLMPMMIK